MTPDQPSFVDSGNSLLAPVPARLETGTIESPSGKLAVLTIRSATTTMTVMIGVKDLRNWTGILGALADSMAMSGSVVPASVVDVADLGQIFRPHTGR